MRGDGSLGSDFWADCIMNRTKSHGLFVMVFLQMYSVDFDIWKYCGHIRTV